MTVPTVTQKVWNPDFVQDLIRFVNLSMTQQDAEMALDFIKEKTPTTYEKLQTLVDRIEFIEHLNIIKTEAKRQNFQFGKFEVRGIDWDIDALRIYLSLSCVDILSSNFEPFDAWILDNCADFEAGQEIKDYLARKSAEYREDFQLSSNFVKAFTRASDDLKNQICREVAVVKGEEQSSGIERIATYLYRVRNKYTHEGRRFFTEPIPCVRIQAIGLRDEEHLHIKTGFNIVAAVLQVAIEQAARTLERYAEQRAAQRTGSSCASAGR